MKVIVVIVVAIVAFEVIEHVVAPLIWAFVTRKKRSVSGATGLLGQVAVVRHWKDTEGYVFVKGELWKAVSNEPFSVGDKAVVRSVEGLTLRVSPSSKPDR
jgi:membrane-bound serine protease (ClpP class)